MTGSRFCRAVICAALFALPFSVSAAADEEDATMTFKSLTPDAALKVATAALEACRAEGFQVAVAVVDRAGVTQVLIRDRFAGTHTIETSTRKAWTAASFKASTSEMAEMVKSGEIAGIEQLPYVALIGGGVIIEDGEGSLLGAVGVSGAPGGDRDQDCAEAGIAAIEDQIAF